MTKEQARKAIAVFGDRFYLGELDDNKVSIGEIIPVKSRRWNAPHFPYMHTGLFQSYNLLISDLADGNAETLLGLEMTR